MRIRSFILSTIYDYLLIIILPSLHLLLTSLDSSDRVQLDESAPSLAILYSANLSWRSMNIHISESTKNSSYIVMDLLGSLAMAPCSAGIIAPLAGLFLLLKSSQIFAMVTHFTPGFLLIYSINLRRKLSLKTIRITWFALRETHLSSMRIACGCPLTSG